jgi:3-methylcrotonyl-CoA carboxylase beta subunit
MGGHQAASTLATIRRDTLARAGSDWPAGEEQAFRAELLEQYERQGSPYYSTARLWDDGIIDPRETRTVLSVALSICANAPLEPVRHGVFRM